MRGSWAGQAQPVNRSNSSIWGRRPYEVESVEALVAVCKQWGAATEVKKRPPNREAESRVWDPDGNPVDLSQHGWPH
jgi:hypothetical protein